MSELGLGRTLIAPTTRTPPPAADDSYLRQLLERQPGCLVRVPQDGVFLACNDAALSLFGVDTLGAILDTNLTDRLVATDRGDWQEFASRVWTGGAASVECHLALPDGADRTVLFQGIAIKDHPDGINSLLISLRDTSLAHRLETSLKSEEVSREAHDGRQKETLEQLEQALAERQQLAAQIEEHQAERQRLTAALDAQIVDRQQREAEYREQSSAIEEGQRERRWQLDQALAERRQLAAQIEEYQAERQRLTAALDAQIADRQQREAEYRAQSSALEGGQSEKREQLDQALAERRQLGAQIEEHQAERQRLTAALDAQIADRQKREAEYREQSSAIEEGQREALATRPGARGTPAAWRADRGAPGRTAASDRGPRCANGGSPAARGRVPGAVLPARKWTVREARATRTGARGTPTACHADRGASGRTAASDRGPRCANRGSPAEGGGIPGAVLGDEEGQRERREQLDQALAERRQLAAQIEEYQAEGQRLTAALDAQIADRQQREAEYRAQASALEGQTEKREQLEQALAERQRLAAQIEEYQAERQRLTAALDAQIADRQQREAEYREKSAELERRAEENQLAFLIRERETSGRIAALEAELSASATEQQRLARAYEQQLGEAGQPDPTSQEQNRQELADLELRLQAATAEQARLLALAAEDEARGKQLDAEHRAALDNREQSLSRAREERALGIAQAHQELSELGSQLSRALGEQNRLSGLIEESERERDRIDAEHRRAIADLETSNGEALAECERVLTEEHEQVRQQNERQRFEIADLKKRHAEAVAGQQHLSDLVREREDQQKSMDADHSRTIGEIEARHDAAIATRAQAWHDELDQIKRQRDDQRREIGNLKEGQDKAVAEQRRLSELLEQTEDERQQIQEERAAASVELDRRLSNALDQALGTRESANRERIANLQLELAQAVSDQMRLQASAAQGEGRLKRLVAEYGVDRAQAERAMGEAIFKKNRALKALADQRVELQRWQDAATELEPLAAAGRLAADVAGELQEVLRHVDEQAKFVLTLCSSDAVPRAEIETLRADALRAASLARQFALSKVRRPEGPLPAEPEDARVSAHTPTESLEDL